MAENIVDFGGSGLRFPCPKPFNGEEKGFDEFNTKLKSYLNMANSDYRALMLSAQDSENPLNFDDYNPTLRHGENWLGVGIATTGVIGYAWSQVLPAQRDAKDA